MANPPASNTKASEALTPVGGEAARASQVVPLADAMRTAKPARSRTKLRCVIAAYQRTAERTCGRVACSECSRTVDPSAINSHPSRKVTASPAAGTIDMPQRKIGYAAHAARVAVAPWA